MSAEPAPAPTAPQPRAHWIVWLFALVGLGGILAFIFLIAIVAAPSGRHQPARVAGDKAEESFTVGSVEPLAGTDLVQMEIAASEASGSYSGERDVRNILLLDRRSGAHRRILPDNRRRVRSARFLSASGEAAGLAPQILPGEAQRGDGSKSPAAYYLLDVEDPRDREKIDVLVGRLADGRQAFVMTGIDGIDSVWMDAPTRIGMVVRERFGLYYRIVDVQSLKLVENRKIAID